MHPRGSGIPLRSAFTFAHRPALLAQMFGNEQHMKRLSLSRVSSNMEIPTNCPFRLLWSICLMGLLEVFYSGSTTRAAGQVVAWGSPVNAIPTVPADRKSTRLNSSHLGISYA